MAIMRIIGNDTELDRILNRDFVSVARKGYVEIGEDSFCLPVHYSDYEEKIRNFEVREDDIFITGHPKSGTTWVQEMAWMIQNNLNYAEGAKEPIFVRSPQLEFMGLFDYKEFTKGLHMNNKAFLDNPFKCMVESKEPRCIKTHLHWSLLPEQIQNNTKQPKIITVLRNAPDCCVSLYYHSQTIESYKGTFEDFCELFLAGRVCFGPFWKQVLSYWREKDRPNILFLKYKEIKEDRIAVINKVAKFLGKTFTEAQVQKFAEHLSFESMKNNPSLNHDEVRKDLIKSGLAVADNAFIRSGNVGGYRAKMSLELIQRFDAWGKENLAGTGLAVE